MIFINNVVLYENRSAMCTYRKINFCAYCFTKRSLPLKSISLLI